MPNIYTASPLTLQNGPVKWEISFIVHMTAHRLHGVLKADLPAKDLVLVTFWPFVSWGVAEGAAGTLQALTCLSPSLPLPSLSQILWALQ